MGSISQLRGGLHRITNQNLTADDPLWYPVYSYMLTARATGVRGEITPGKRALRSLSHAWASCNPLRDRPAFLLSARVGVFAASVNRTKGIACLYQPPPPA